MLFSFVDEDDPFLLIFRNERAYQHPDEVDAFGVVDEGLL